MFREAHWEWTGAGIYLLLIILIAIALFQFDRLKPYINSTIFINLIAVVFSCYFISEMMLDHNWARIPKDFGEKIRFRSSLEESMEVVGHFFLAISVLLVTRQEQIAEKMDRGNKIN